MTYVALTIGPIYKTLEGAKKPKELFSASYLFSYIMKQIILEFKSRDFVVPYIGESIFEDKIDVGLFHDRFIFKAEEGDLSLLKEKVIPVVIADVSDKLHVDKAYLEQYLQLHYDAYEVEDNENPVLKIMPYLDAAELFYQTERGGDGLLQKALKNKENFFVKNKKIVDDLKQLTYESYFAIVHADGDKMGEVIKDKEKLPQISKSLFDYCINANDKIREFGGQTIFAGGDDLLFFVPVVNKTKDRTVFDLCEEIANDFEKRMEHKATLSFGVGITYVKFPLYEALKKSRELLNNKAKTKNKNNLAFEVTKHSGQSFGGVLPKSNTEVYRNFLALTSNIKGGSGVNNFLHSLHHKLDTYSVIIDEIGKDEKKLKNFFTNYFNNDEHKQYPDFFEQIIAYIHSVYTDAGIEDEEKLKIIYSTLRFVKFVQGDK